MTIKLSLLALQDLQGISRHTLDRWGKEQEEHYLNTIYDLFEEISAAPDRWRYRHSLYPECQSALCQKHIIFFRQQRGVILVSRVLHQQMDHKRHLTAESFED